MAIDESLISKVIHYCDLVKTNKDFDYPFEDTPLVRAIKELYTTAVDEAYVEGYSDRIELEVERKMIKQGQTVRAGDFFAEHYKPEDRKKYHIRPLALGEPSLLIQTKRGEKLVGANHQITYLGEGLWQV